MNEQTEVSNEATAEVISEWLEPSPVGSEFMRHSAAMEPAARVPVHKAFQIAPGFNVGMLRKMAEAYKPKRIVVIDHEQNGFEVRRLGNSDDVSLFYASLNKGESSNSFASNEQAKYIKKVLVEFLTMEEDQVIKYDAQGAKLREAGCIGYAYVQRRLANVATFKKDAEGSTAGIKKALSQLESDGYLRKLTEEEANELFGTNATVYRVMKPTKLDKYSNCRIS